MNSIEYGSISTGSKEASQTAEKILKLQEGKMATKISREKNYCRAEEYHQKYIQKKSMK